MGGQTAPTTPPLPDLIRRYGRSRPRRRLHAGGHLLSSVVLGGGGLAGLGLYALSFNRQPPPSPETLCSISVPRRFFSRFLKVRICVFTKQCTPSMKAWPREKLRSFPMGRGYEILHALLSAASWPKTLGLYA